MSEFNALFGEDEVESLVRSDALDGLDKGETLNKLDDLFDD